MAVGATVESLLNVMRTIRPNYSNIVQYLPSSNDNETRFYGRIRSASLAMLAVSTKFSILQAQEIRLKLVKQISSLSYSLERFSRLMWS